MAQLRIALAQVNPTVGDLDGNRALVVESARQAAGQGAHLVVMPEMVVTGYPVEDLALRDSFVSASVKATRELAADLERAGLGDLPVVVGFLSRREGTPASGFEQCSGLSATPTIVLRPPSAHGQHSQSRGAVAT